MPLLYDKLPDSNSKHLARKADRSRRVSQIEKVAMPMQSLIQLRAIQVGLMKRFTQLLKGVDVIVGKGDKQEAVNIVPDKALCDLANTVCKVIEMRRVLLKIPGPGVETKNEQNTIDITPVESVDSVLLMEIEELRSRSKAEDLTGQTGSIQAS